MASRIRVGLDSTKILLTDVGKKWFMYYYPKGVVYEYDENEAFDLKSMGTNFVEIICPLGISYKIPTYIEGEITFKMMKKEDLESLLRGEA